jgi:uncharacterized protein with NRDE domain
VCTLALYFRVLEDYPLIVAANRDEHYDRPSSAPAVIASNPKIVAGKDLRAGGTWLGVNEHGFLAAVLNRRSDDEQPPPPRSRSRGLLCLDLLNHGSAAQARASLEHERQNLYQPFTLVFSDHDEAYAAFNLEKKIEIMPLHPGLHVFSSAAKHNERSEKKERAYTLFSSLLPALKKNIANVSLWTATFSPVLSDHAMGNGNGGNSNEAICVHHDVSGTVSSSIIIYCRRERRFRTFYCAGPPCQNAFTESPALNFQ